MNLRKKHELAVKTLGIGRERIVFNNQRLSEISEAITKQDIRDLLASGAIFIRDIKGKKTIVKRKTRRRTGSIKKKVKNGKTKYVQRTRKLRNYISEIRKQGKLSNEEYRILRKEIRASIHPNKSHVAERIAGMKKK